MNVAVVLAAGKGTRMGSERPKVLHEAAGRPLVTWVVDAARRAGCERVVVVVGPEHDGVRRRLVEAFGDGDSAPPWLAWAVQEERRGTGHALLQAREALSGVRGRALVLSGDAPLVTPETLRALHQAADDAWGALAVAELDRPGSLGRVLTDERGDLDRIVEAADASPEELRVRRINAGFYALPVPEVFEDLDRATPDNAQGEIYLTDAPSAAAERGERVALHVLADPTEAWGVNTPEELERAHRRLLHRRTGEA